MDSSDQSDYESDEGLPRRSGRQKKRPKLFVEEQIEFDYDKKIIKKIREIERSNIIEQSNTKQGKPTDNYFQEKEQHKFKIMSIPTKLMTSKQSEIYDEEAIKILQSEFSSTENYWKSFPLINLINSSYPIYPIQTIVCKAPIVSLAISPKGDMLAFCSLLGEVYVYSNYCNILEDINNNVDNSYLINNPINVSHYNTWQLLGVLRDDKEKDIDEFYYLSFTPCGKNIYAAGAVKSRTQFDDSNVDLKTMPCTLVRFDLHTLLFTKDNVETNVDPDDADIMDPLDFLPCVRYYGHLETITGFKMAKYKGKNYILSYGFDGHIIKWRFDKHWKKEKEKCIFYDDYSLKIYSIAFLPNCYNRYFIAAVDKGLHLYDFENNRLIQRWPELYSTCCQYAKVIKLWEDNMYYIVTKGINGENCEINCYELKEPSLDHNQNIRSSKKCIPWKLNLLSKFSDPLHISKHWATRFASNGIYLVSSSSNGKVFIWNLKSGRLTGVLADHDRGKSAYDVLFHPYLPLLFTAGEDGKVIIYSYQKGVQGIT